MVSWQGRLRAWRSLGRRVCRLPQTGFWHLRAAQRRRTWQDLLVWTLISPLTRPLLPDTPLVDTCMAWLADNEDPGRTIDERRRHIYRLVKEYPSVYTRHAQDGSNPPPPEVRTALRDIGGFAGGEWF